MALHPGEILMEHILLPSVLSIRRAAERLEVSDESLGQVIAGQTPITLPLAHALAREFSFSRQWWLDLQKAWDDEQRLAA